MLDRGKSCFDWNHISKDLSPEQITELRSYYRLYHKKAFAFKVAYKHYKRCKNNWTWFIHFVCKWGYYFKCCYVRCISNSN